jgi:rhamnosyltransferase subunit B
MARFVLTTFGSFGDLHPYIAVALALRSRGHHVTVVASEAYRLKVESEGLGFHPCPPDLTQFLDDPEAFRMAMHPRLGTQYILTKMVLPYLRQSYHATLDACQDADLIVSHLLSFATPLAAEKLGKRWVQAALQPMAYMSTEEPMMHPAFSFLSPLHAVSPAFYRKIFQALAGVSRFWARPIHRLRQELGLPPSRQNPLLEGMFSPHGNQSWFSRHFAPPLSDWPAGSEPLGFPFYDQLIAGQPLPPGLQAFLDAGEPPVVFTLGSAAVMTAGPFYTEALKAVEMLGCRAVMLVGVFGRNPLPPVSSKVFVGDYAPYSAVFPRALATVHQGGVGTTAQALRSGHPTVIVPFSHDQPDNAARCVRLGVGRTVSRAKYSARTIAEALRGIDALAPRARELGAHIASEDGLTRICEGLEAHLK